ncbi:MAG TPA: PEP/pyruvate-binding domain-containing protein, partial [Vicinamibacteria bacterium]|nr:PEP/pyruvate-binding domain-containing protein [Vicinamibacteria bacterium]
MRRAVLDLDAVRASDRARVGSKAAALAALRQAGLPVPPGFVLCADAVADGHAALRQAYAAFGGRVAVRSSGTSEDLDGASFAGQYVTVLDVAGETNVVAAAERCLASSAGAGAYADAVAAPRGRMAVLVQRFVEPDAAGVAFTEHPGERGALLVEAHAGRGEAVVSGRVRPAAYRVERASRAVSGPADGPLGRADVLHIVELALEAERLFGSPQDVEWARGGEGLVLLQSRPITVERSETLPPGARRLTRANVGEVLPGPIAPLTWSSVVAFLERAFARVARRAGILPADVPGPFLVHYRARAYLNLSLCLEVGARLPGVTAADAERLVLGVGAAGPPSRRPPLRALPRILGVLARLLAMARRLPAEVDAVERRILALPGLETLERTPFDRLPELWAEWLATGDDVAGAHVAISGACGFRLALLQGLLGRLPGDPVDLANRLLAGTEGVESVRPTLALEALAAEARRSPEWRAWLAAPEGEPPPALGARLGAFLAEFGHRSVSEADLASPAWEDDRTPVLAALQTLVAGERPSGFGHAARAAAREADLEAVRHRLGPLLGQIADALLGSAVRGVRERERTKSLAVRAVAHGRRLARVTARHLVERGLLASPADVHFLRVDELVALLVGRPVARSLLLRRRNSHERESRLEAPREVDRDAPPGAADAPATWAGIPASAGVGAGPARVLRAGDALELRPGEVLVAPVLDAAFGPLLAAAAGAVAEIGGLLSHGAVVARELGVPCVVDVRGATARIRTGERVLVDGGAGRVQVLSDAIEAAAPAARSVAGLASPSPAEDERLHPLDPHPRARESVYFNLQDP